MKAGLAELEQWCIYATEEVCSSFFFLSKFWTIFSLYANIMLHKQYAGSSWEELKHIRQAVGFLVCILCSLDVLFATF